MKSGIYSLIIITFLLFFSCNNSNKVKNDIERRNLNGKVKSITENSYQAVEKFGEIVKGEKIVDFVNKENRITSFNEKGYLTEDTSLFHIKYKYNKQNKIIEENYGEGMKMFYKYNDKGFILEENQYQNKDLVQKTKCICDKKGNVIERNYYEGNGKFRSKEKITFKDNEYVSKSYNADGTLEYSSKSDKNGNEIESIHYDSYGNIENKWIYKYDENNQKIEFIDSTINIVTTYKYLKLDSNRNWTQQIEFENDYPIKIIERKIEYFK